MQAIFLEASGKKPEPKRASVEMPRRSIESPRRSVEAPGRSVDAPRPSAAAAPPPSSFGNDLEHSWAPVNTRGVPREYADLAAAKASAEARRAERERNAALESRETQLERRERAVRLKEQQRRDAEERRRQQADAEVRKQKAAQLEERERQLRKEERQKAKQELRSRPKPPPFNYAKEKPNMILAIANANQAANNLLNALRVGPPPEGGARRVGAFRLTQSFPLGSTSTASAKTSRRMGRSSCVSIGPSLRDVRLFVTFR